ncbi:MAG: eukaryotic-like serine/threonine-protein kinase, partial [Myxococcales bacterium]|nr:eukaryotic-like serine/threonine-protein kinase [Myxococcales bacterium]
ESDLDTLAKVQECNVARPSTLIRGYPVDLEKIVMKALAKNRGERFRTARELSRALQSLLMRRGLFIASDEVAAYTQSIFNDRIQKREAHLRWAAEVTSTINVDQLLSKPKLGPEFTGNSDVQAQAKPAGVRPAAGMPAAPITGPMAEPEPQQGRGQSQHAYNSGPTNIPDDLKSTASSLETQARPLSANMGGSPAARAAAAAVHRNNPSLQHQQQQQQQQQDDDDEHPADGDGPTIQASSPMPDALPPLHMGGHLGVDRHRDREPQRSEPPTLMQPSEAGPASQNDGPTMMASPAARGAMLKSSSSDEVMAIEPEEDFEEDQDATMVANTRGEGNPLQAPPTFPQVSPAAGRSNVPSQRRPAPQPFAQTAALGQQMPPMLNPLGFPQQPTQQSLARSGEMPFGNNETLGMPPGHSGMGHPGHDPQDFRMGAQAVDFNPRSGPHPTGESGQFIPRHSQRMQPPNMRMGAPTYDNRTMTAQRYKRRPPMWVVAALSCSIALLIAGVVIAIVSSTSGTTPKGAAGSPTASGAVASGASGAPSPAGSGPFTAARTAFNNIVAQPGSGLTPPSGSPGAPGSNPGFPAAAVTAPPVMTAAAPDPAPSPATPAVAAATPAVAAVTAQPAIAPVAATPPPAPRPASTPVAVAAPAAPPTPAPTVRKPAALGAITVVCMPKCDQIIDNGTSLGPGHIFNRPVPSGRHVLQLSAPNGARKNLVVEVAPEQTKEVRMSMDK